MDERLPRRHRPASVPPPPCAQPLLTAAARQPERFSRRVIRLDAGEERAFDAREWHDALVVLEAGALELVGEAGTRTRLSSGSILWLAGLPLGTLRNVGAHPAVLVALTRR